jgi:hypothetical protein
MTNYNSLLDYHKQIGLWNSDEKLSRHGYVLSPEKFVLDSQMQSQLQEIGKAVYQFQHDAISLARLVSSGNGDHAKGMMFKVLKESLNGFPFAISERIAPLCKVDLMVDSHGNFKIAEIDAYNPRGMAYSMFLNEMHKDLGNVKAENMLSGVLASDGFFRKSFQNFSNPMWIYSHRERYYEPILKIMNGFMKSKFDCSMELVSAVDFEKIRETQKCKYRNFLMIPWGMQQPEEQETKRFLLEKYFENEQSFIFPLTPWAGSKGLLGLVSKPYSYELENIVHECFSQLCSLRKFLPQTLLVSKRNKENLEDFLKENPECILKANFSSGMKGVWFKPDEIKTNLAKAVTQKNPAYTVQELINQKKFDFQAFDSSGGLYDGQWYIRLVIHVDDMGNVVDAVVTGRPEPDVHGAPDCIMLPCVLG